MLVEGKRDKYQKSGKLKDNFLHIKLGTRANDRRVNRR